MNYIVAPDIAKTLLSFSGSENGASKALEWLRLKWGRPHLQIHAVFDKIKATPHARPQSQVPKTAEKILESLSQLMQYAKQPLPSDVTTIIFRCLHLSTEEKKEILPLLENAAGISIETMHTFIVECFRLYELMNLTINKHWQGSKQTPPPTFRPEPVSLLP